MIALKLTEIAKATGGRLIGRDLSISNISCNSKETKPGSLFIPIIGKNFDAHVFIGEALQSGAEAFISDREVQTNRPYIVVKDTRCSLGDLASYYISLFDIPVIAVTGSSGKTSVKNGIAAVLSQKYRVLKTEGNLNNDIGLPITAFGLEKGHETAVFEMGMNNPGEISYLSKIARPDFGVVTNVGTAHIERLGSREGILQAKLEIIDGMKDSGVIILNYDNDLLKAAEKKIPRKILWVSATEEIGVYAKNIRTGYDGARFTIRYRGRGVDVAIKEGELPFITNALMAAAVGFSLGLSDDEVRRGVEVCRNESGRMEVYRIKSGLEIIDDCYNANTDSMRLALDALSRRSAKKTAILGDMLEQGEYAKSFHVDIGEYAYATGVDVLIAIGNDAKYYKGAFDAINTEGRESYYFRDKKEFFDAGINIGGDEAVLVKASRGMQFEEIINYLKESEE